MDIVERMTASQPAHLGWKPESAMEFGQRICNGVSSQIAEMGQHYERLKSDLRQPCKQSLHVRAHLRTKPHRVSPLRSAPFAAAIPGDSAIEAVLTTGFSSFLSLYNTIIICRILLTWFPNPPQAVANPLSTLCDPYLNLFRGIIPPIGGTLDLSPILAFVVLDLFQNTAAALPAELGPDGQYEARQKRRQFMMFNPTRAALAWHKRLTSQKQRTEAASA